MTCKQLGGACDMEFHAETFDDMAKQSQEHGRKMKEANDEAHIKAMDEMMQKMQNPAEMDAWMEEKRKEFDELAED